MCFFPAVEQQPWCSTKSRYSIPKRPWQFCWLVTLFGIVIQVTRNQRLNRDLPTAGDPKGYEIELYTLGSKLPMKSPPFLLDCRRWNHGDLGWLHPHPNSTRIRWPWSEVSNFLTSQLKTNKRGAVRLPTWRGCNRVFGDATDVLKMPFFKDQQNWRLITLLMIYIYRYISSRFLPFQPTMSKKTKNNTHCVPKRKEHRKKNSKLLKPKGWLLGGSS